MVARILVLKGSRRGRMLTARYNVEEPPSGVYMGAFEQFYAWLTSSNGVAPQKAHPDLNPIDVVKLAKELDLQGKASTLGEAGLPSDEQTGLSGPEAAIVQRVERKRQEYVDWASLRLNILSRDLSRWNITAQVNRARQADEEFERKASSLLSEHDASLRRLAEIARSKKDALASFKSLHNLSREAAERTTTGRFFRFSVVIVLILLEAIVNASFFATGLDSGLLGGFFEAGMAATFNVGVAFILGRFAVPYVAHAKAGWKLVGLISMFMALAAICVVALAISHYRDALISEVLNATSVAQHALLSNPLGLTPGSSWGLFAFSVTFALIALIDGVFYDDIYPGYGAVSRRAEEAVLDYEDRLTEVREDLENLKESELRALDRVLEESQAAISAFESTIRDKTSAGLRLQQAVTDADNSLEALLKLFRTENELHRGGAGRPRYFNTYPQLRSLTLPSFDTSADEQVLREQRGLVSSLLAEAQTIRARIQAAFNKQFDRINPLDAHFPTEGAS